MDTTDVASYPTLFGQYAPRVKGYLVRRGLPEAAADEVTQEVMLTVWRKGEQYDATRSSVSTWVFTIARNRCIDHMRKHRRPEPDPEDPCWVSTVAEQDSEPEAAAMAVSRSAALERALAQLNDEQRAALESLYFREQTADETARAEGVPIGTIKSRARRAIATLRRALRGGDLDDA